MSVRKALLTGRSITIALAALLTLAPVIMPVAVRVVWNTTASVPTGLYAVQDTKNLQVGERVALLPPPALRRLLTERRYLGADALLLKRIAAVGGQRVCRFGHGVTIDDEYVGAAQARDRLGRILPAWSGCHTLLGDELFLMNRAAPDSFDGRYFGALRIADVIGRVTPLWTDEAGDGRHVWFADRANPSLQPPAKEPRSCKSVRSQRPPPDFPDASRRSTSIPS